MKTSVAVVMGFFSGLLIYFMAAMVFTGRSVPPSAFFFGITFLGGWIASAYVMRKGAISVSKVFSRGFLIGAAQWFCMIPVGMIFAGKAITESVGNAASSTAATVGATLGGGIVAFLTGGLSIAMALTCLIGFAISYFLGKEMQPEVAIAANKDVGLKNAPTGQMANAVVSQPSDSTMTLYEMIGVDSSVGTQEIEATCLKLAEQFRPDKNIGDLQAAVRFRDIEKAYEILGDAQKRKAYDAQLGAQM